MINTNNDNVNSQNNFFGNADVPYQMKAGAAAVLLHATPTYYKNSEGQDCFVAMFFDKDTTKTGKANRIVNGAMTQTFGVDSSMAASNCRATLKKLAELYPALGNALENITDNSQSKLPDEEICKVLAGASAERFRLSQEGSFENWENYVSKNFDEYVKQCKSHYPGLISADVYDNVKNAYENACKKKTIAQAQMS